MLVRDGASYTTPGRGRFAWRWLALGASALLFAIWITGCGGGGDDGGESVDTVQLRLRFIRNIGNGFIVPTYAAMETAADTLTRHAKDFCMAPDVSKLMAAQMQWRQVVGLWTESELVLFGPAVINRVHGEIDALYGRHGDADRIEARIAGSRDIVAKELAASMRGLEGVEYLLFGNMDQNDDIIGAYTGSTRARRCEYLEAIVDDLHANIKVFSDSWRSGQGDYINLWNTAGEATNTAYRFVQSAINALMNELEFVIDDLVNVKLQQVNWVQRKPESWRSGNSIANIRHRIEAAQMIYLGFDRDTGEDQFGMDDYLRQTGKTDLDAQIRAKFGLALDALDAIPGTLADAVVSNLTIVDEAEVKSRDLLRLLKHKLAKHLNVFFGFDETDGD